MKKLIKGTILSLSIVAVLALVGCGKKKATTTVKNHPTTETKTTTQKKETTKVHTHSYNIKNVDEKYLMSEATCKNAATYYYSCSCGEKGSETFTVGQALNHNLDATGKCLNDGCDFDCCQDYQFNATKTYKVYDGKVYAKTSGEICSLYHFYAKAPKFSIREIFIYKNGDYITNLCTTASVVTSNSGDIEINGNITKFIIADIVYFVFDVDRSLDEITIADYSTMVNHSFLAPNYLGNKDGKIGRYCVNCYSDIKAFDSKSLNSINELKDDSCTITCTTNDSVIAYKFSVDKASTYRIENAVTNPTGTYHVSLCTYNEANNNYSSYSKAILVPNTVYYFIGSAIDTSNGEPKTFESTLNIYEAIDVVDSFDATQIADNGVALLKFTLPSDGVFEIIADYSATGFDYDFIDISTGEKVLSVEGNKEDSAYVLVKNESGATATGTIYISEAIPE